MSDGTIRILRIIARMNVGGPAWQASALTRGLASDGFETRLLCGEVEPHEADFLELRVEDLEVHRIAPLGRSVRLLDDLRALLAIRREIRAFKPDVIHTHAAKAGVLGRIAAVTTGSQVRVHTYHGHLLNGYFSALGTRVVRAVEAFLARFTTVLVAVGQQVSDDLLAVGIGHPGQYVVIPPGVDQPTLPSRDSAREQLGLPLDVPVVLFVGRLTGVKRPDRLIEAFAMVREQVPTALLLVAGEGDLFDSTRELAKGLEGSVRFFGWQRDVASLYAAADLVILTSDNEGMPVTLIEAAAAGLPSVTTDVGSAREVVVHGETGLVVVPTPAATADAVIRLLGDGALRARMGDAAGKRAHDSFSTRRLVDDHASLYRRLVNVAR